jgi:hypothetical protein
MDRQYKKQQTHTSNNGTYSYNLYTKQLGCMIGSFPLPSAVVADDIVVATSKLLLMDALHLSSPSVLYLFCCFVLRCRTVVLVVVVVSLLSIVSTTVNESF